MENVTSSDPVQITADTFVFPSHLKLPGLGMLPVNAFLILADQPILIDTGMGAVCDKFVRRLEQIIDLEDLRWIWQTHMDFDHIGALARVMEAAPQAKLVTTYLGMGKLNLHMPVAPERVFLLNPGQKLDVGDRKLAALRPPVFDAPETTALFDPKSRALFSADSFGALMHEPAETASDIKAKDRREGMLTWASIDAPWLHHYDEGALDEAIASLQKLSPRFLLSAHLPPAIDMIDQLAADLRKAKGIEPFLGPDQAALEELMRAEAEKNAPPFPPTPAPRRRQP